MLAPIRFRPSRGVKGGDVCSKLVVLRERLQAIHFCTLERLFRDYPTDLGLRLPSTVSPPYVLIRAPSNVARSKTSSSNPLLGTQRGDRNQADENGRELGGGSLVDTIYCKSYTRTAAAIGTIQLGAEDRTRKFGTKDPPPLYATSRVPRAYTAYYMICYSRKRCNGTFSSRFSPMIH